MAKSVALLRGVNVGGKNSLPMASLVDVLQSLGLTKVQTYIQSGNAVFESSDQVDASLADGIASRIEARHGFRPHVMVLSEAEFSRALAENPYADAASDPKTVHFFFLAASPDEACLERLESLRQETEEYRLAARVLYLHAPNGIGRSKLAAGLERALRVATTARNLRTVMKLAAVVYGD